MIKGVCQMLDRDFIINFKFDGQLADSQLQTEQRFLPDILFSISMSGKISS